MADTSRKIAELRSEIKQLQRAPLLSKASHAERIAELSLEIVDELDARLGAVEACMFPEKQTREGA